MDDQSPALYWEADEFAYYPKSLGWYAVLCSIALFVIAFFVLIQKDIFAAVSLGLITIIIILFSRHTPSRITIELTTQGIKFGKLFFPYKQLKYFWVVHDKNHQTINFHTSTLVNNTLILELGEQDPEMARDFLLQFLPEHPATQATIPQKIMQKFRF